MLDVTTNQNMNCMSSGMAGGAGLDDDMDPLFDEDWLHENNLDILFDLFEEEMERKGMEASSTNSSSVFGTSPITSYLFGTSPSLASALDLYDLQQAAAANSTTNNQAIKNTADTFNINGQQTNYNSSNPQQLSRNASANHIATSITNAVRIKRKLKKGQNEGVSLLARPFSSNSSSSSNSSGNISIINKNNSDKTSTKITNLNKSTISNHCSSQGIDINYTKQSHHDRNRHLHHHHHHVHYITGCSVILEHAYAVRGH